MGVWDTYTNRIETMGGTKRGTRLKREVRMINNKLPDNLSYHSAHIFDAEHGYNITDEQIQTSVMQNVAIINSDNLDEKYIYSMPGEDIRCGSLVLWMDNYWLVSERDANTTVYTRAKLVQCNHLLKWVSADGRIIEQWCMVEDGTKLKRTVMRDSLAYWKRYVKTIPLIAGNPLEPLPHSVWMKYAKARRVKKRADWAISSKASNRGMFNDYPGSGSRNCVPKRGTLNRSGGMVKI